MSSKCSKNAPAANLARLRHQRQPTMIHDFLPGFETPTATASRSPAKPASPLLVSRAIAFQAGNPLKPKRPAMPSTDFRFTQWAAHLRLSLPEQAVVRRRPRFWSLPQLRRADA